MKRNFGVLIFAIAVAQVASAQTPPPPPPPAATVTLTADSTTPLTLTLQDALHRALEVNNSVERSRADIGVAEANRSYLLSQVLPRISADGALQRNSIETTFGEGEDSVTILPRNDWNYSITLSQPVFAGLREARAYMQSKLLVENARTGSFGSEDEALLRTASLYLALINFDARIEIERRNIELADRRRQQAQDFYEAGEATRVDVLRAEAAVKSVQRALANAEQLRQDAESGLRETLDLDQRFTAVPPAGDVTPPVPAEDTLVASAVSTRPDVQIASNNLKIADLEVAKQKGYWLPVITFDGGWVQQKSPFPASGYTYGALRFNVPIFQSGEVIARVAGAKNRELQAELDLDSAKLNAREDVRRALAALHAAETSTALAVEQLQAAEAAYGQSFELYRAQEMTALDLAASELALAEARRAVAEETLNRDLAELRVWYASGSIKQALGVN